MSSIGLNKWIVSGYLGADVQIKDVELRDGHKAKVANATLYVRKIRDRDESFTVQLNIWEKSSAWRTLSFLKKGSIVICTGAVEPNPYITHTDHSPRAGLSMTVVDIDLDLIRESAEEAANANGTATPSETQQSETQQQEKTPVTAQN